MKLVMLLLALAGVRGGELFQDRWIGRRCSAGLHPAVSQISQSADRAFAGNGWRDRIASARNVPDLPGSAAARGCFAGCNPAIQQIKNLRYEENLRDRAAVGRNLFLKNCAHCHGADASGDEGPDLRGLKKSDPWITRRIREGVKGEMTAFGEKFSQDDIDALIAYLRTLK